MKVTFYYRLGNSDLLREQVYLIISLWRNTLLVQNIVYIEIQKICVNCICRSKTSQLGFGFGLSQTYLNNEATIIIGLTPYISFFV